MPTTIVIESSKAMDNNESLAVIDSLTQKIKSLKGIEKVSSASEPMGDPIDNFYTSTQTKTVVNGLSSANDGVGKINSGLKQINEKLTTPDFSGVKDLSSGTGTIENGMGAVTDGLVKINSGINQGASGADKLTSGIAQLKTGVLSINGGLQSISTNMTKIQAGYVSLGQGYKAMPGAIAQIKQLTLAMNNSVALIDAKLPNDPDVAKLKGMLAQLSGALDATSTGINTANQSYDVLTSGLAKLNEGLKTVIASTGSKSQLIMGINELEKGEASLASGLRKGSAGQETVISSMVKLKAGVSKIKAGQDTLYTGLNTLSGGLTKLKGGISQSQKGLGTIYNGIDKTNSFLTQLTAAKSFYVPKEAFKTADIEKMFNAYMSKDRKITKLTVNLETDPYSAESMKVIGEMNSLVGNHLKGTKLSGVNYGIAGVTANTNDLNNIATHDISFTQIIVYHVYLYC